METAAAHIVARIVKKPDVTNLESLAEASRTRSAK
jgi:hypothetical protein